MEENTILIRRFIKSDQNEVSKLYRDGFLMYHYLGLEIISLQTSFADSKLGLGGDMYDIYESYKISYDENVIFHNFWVAVYLPEK